MDVLFLVAGILLLFVGGELLVRNASLLARFWGLSPLVIGLTVVAFGTSAPELAASVTAGLRDSPEIALGNVIGSNIANIALILGLTALLRPLRTTATFLRREMPIMLGASALLALLLLDGALGRWEGALLSGLLGAFLLFLLKSSEAPEVEEEFEAAYARPRPASPWLAALGALLGLGLLVIGARFLVDAATTLARGFGVPELIIGLTLVAVGTSLPELATSVIAALRREPDIALGNIVGSNIFNILGILGITALVQPIAVPYARVAFDMWMMLGLSALLMPFLLTGLRLGRREGAVLLAIYLAYVAYLYLG